MLIIKNFSKSYNGFPVLSVPELQLTAGAYWIKGENGSRKTTFFKSLAGLLPHQGTVSFNDGITLKDHGIEFRRRVNYCEAEPLYPSFLTAKDLMFFIGKAKGSSSSQQEHLIQAFGIQAFYTTPCETYSSGMIKKLALAMSFLGKPKLIILDEPLITLDEQARRELFKLINASIANETIFLISSHQPIEGTSLFIKETYAIINKQLTPA